MRSAEMLQTLRDVIQQAVSECYDPELLYDIWRLTIELIGDPVDYDSRS